MAQTATDRPDNVSLVQKIGINGGRKGVTFLPEPDRQPRFAPIISVDDHVVEPPHVFQGRVPAQFKDRAPRVEETEDGTQIWVYEDYRQYNMAISAVVGRPIEEC